MIGLIRIEETQKQCYVKTGEHYVARVAKIKVLQLQAKELLVNYQKLEETKDSSLQIS